MSYFVCLERRVMCEWALHACVLSMIYRVCYKSCDNSCNRMRNDIKFFSCSVGFFFFLNIRITTCSFSTIISKGRACVHIFFVFRIKIKKRNFYFVYLFLWFFFFFLFAMKLIKNMHNIL